MAGVKADTLEKLREELQNLCQVVQRAAHSDSTDESLLSIDAATENANHIAKFLGDLVSRNANSKKVAESGTIFDLEILHDSMEILSPNLRGRCGANVRVALCNLGKTNLEELRERAANAASDEGNPYAELEPTVLMKVAGLNIDPDVVCDVLTEHARAFKVPDDQAQVMFQFLLAATAIVETVATSLLEAAVSVHVSEVDTGARAGEITKEQLAIGLASDEDVAKLLGVKHQPYTPSTVGVDIPKGEDINIFMREAMSATGESDSAWKPLEFKFKTDSNERVASFAKRLQAHINDVFSHPLQPVQVSTVSIRRQSGKPIRPNMSMGSVASEGDTLAFVQSISASVEMMKPCTERTLPSGWSPKEAGNEVVPAPLPETEPKGGYTLLPVYQVITSSNMMFARRTMEASATSLYYPRHQGHHYLVDESARVAGGDLTVEKAKEWVGRCIQVVTSEIPHLISTMILHGVSKDVLHVCLIVEGDVSVEYHSIPFGGSVSAGDDSLIWAGLAVYQGPDCPSECPAYSNWIQRLRALALECKKSGGFVIPSGTIDIADPSAVSAQIPNEGEDEPSIANALPGKWIPVPAVPQDKSTVLQLIIHHCDYSAPPLDSESWVGSGGAETDSGCLGVFDHKFFNKSEEMKKLVGPDEEGAMYYVDRLTDVLGEWAGSMLQIHKEAGSLFTMVPHGVIVRSGFGDGLYPFWTATDGETGKVYAIRISFCDAL